MREEVSKDIDGRFTKAGNRREIQSTRIRKEKTMMKRPKFMFAFCMILVMVICLLLGSRRTYAQQGTYKWVDEKGTIHFTEDPGTIPEKYRDKVRNPDTGDVRQDSRDIVPDKGDIRQDRRDIRKDSRDIRSDRKDLEKAVKSGDKGKIAEERKDLRSDVRDRNKDVKDLRKDRADRRGDVRDLKADKRDRRHDVQAEKNTK
jgi:hypothetical protein